ncbi:MAG: alanine--tRNA ligase [Bacteroidetes bacterium]|nr:alanine--tRNA ligase [Bacteroidota bacterium]MCH8523893.1 alanine--tRNA ligase [Balneolales bacterium]
MSVKTSDQIRQEFLDFFREKQHAITSSAPVVPADDPTLLFTNAGMNQFKAIFLGEEPGYTADGKLWQRAANTQKCIRVSGKHNDLEEVGHDTYHHTLFEMLGNWSFGDYFKEEAIEWAWELLVDRWGLEADRLYITVFGGDDEDGLPADEEAATLWKSKTGVNPKHVLKFGKKDNFWEMGETGPCGPCSEIHIDLRSNEERARVDGATLVNADDPRVMEIWNLVFIQFNRESDGKLVTLPAQHVDTGMGFERICAVIQGKTSNYDSDVFTPIISNISRLAGVPYGQEDQTDIAMRVIADHIRAVSFSVADGASPSNDGRGYVIRRILRRAVRYGWDKLNLKQPFMHKLVTPLADRFANVFPELKQQEKFVSNIIRAEEEAFLRTLGQGIQLFETMIEGQNLLSGSDAFKLHDTYGFPIDLTTLMAREKGINVDQQEFNRLMQEQKDRARAAGKFTVDMSSKEDWVTISEGTDSDFVGYTTLEEQVQIRSVRKEKDQYLILLDKTPFYAESGGQVGDTGILTNGDVNIQVLDVKKNQGRFYHVVGTLPDTLEGTWHAIVDKERRAEIQKHHTATHLMHASLRRHLGTHVNQKGSLVEADRLRFDFSHYEAVSQETLDAVETEINSRIQLNTKVDILSDVPIDDAQEMGAMMLFGEKYGEKVRVVVIDPEYSIELCGGTHVGSTGEIGYFRFISESSAASGVRRVEAVVGQHADSLLRKEKQTLAAISSLIGPNKDSLVALEKLITEKKELEKEIDRVKSQQAMLQLDSVLSNGNTLDSGIHVITGEIPGASADMLKQLGYEILRRRPENTVAVLGSRDHENSKVYLVSTVTEDLVKGSGLKAGVLVGSVAKLVGGGGGGQAGLATAGGRFPDKLPEALSAVTSLL